MMRLGELSGKYESNSNPAIVARSAGDAGGWSYGLYQFSSEAGSVQDFVEWLCLHDRDDCHRFGGSFLDQYQYVFGITGGRRSAKNTQWHLSQNVVGAGSCFLLVVDDTEECFADHDRRWRK